MAHDGFVMTIDSDAEDIDEVEPVKVPSKGKSKAIDKVLDDENGALNPEFSFDLLGDPYADVLGDQATLVDLVKGSIRVSLPLFYAIGMLNTPAAGTCVGG